MDGSRATSLSNITIESGLSNINKEMNNLNIRHVQGQMGSPGGHMAQPMPMGLNGHGQIQGHPMSHSPCAGFNNVPTNPSSRGEPVKFAPVEDTPVGFHSRTSSISSLSNLSADSEVDLDNLAQIGMPDRKPKEKRPEQILESGFTLPNSQIPQQNPISPIRKPNFETRPFEPTWNEHLNDRSGGSLPPTASDYKHRR